MIVKFIWILPLASKSTKSTAWTWGTTVVLLMHARTRPLTRYGAIAFHMLKSGNIRYEFN
jgi:hypothetical protein